jgi:hypothetical protein
MTRDEYLEMLATEPATPTQVGAILGEFRRLGVDNRAERLAVSAELLGLDGLGSTTDLVMGQAGQLVAMLRRVRDRAELPDVATAADDDQDDEHGSEDSGQVPVMTLAEALKRFALMLWLVFGDDSSTAKLADIGISVDQLAERDLSSSQIPVIGPHANGGFPGDGN